MAHIIVDEPPAGYGFALTSAQVPVAQIPANLPSLSDAENTPGGNAPVSRSVAPGDKDTVPSKLARGATGVDLTASYGGGYGHAIAAGLVLTAGIGLTLIIGAGHALIGGVVERTATTYALPDNKDGTPITDRIWVWLQQSGSPTHTLTTTPPSSICCLLGSVTTSGGVITSIDLSGVYYRRGGILYRKTADAGAPADTPSGNIILIAETAGGVFLWTGTAWLSLSALDLHDIKASVRAATTAALAACTYANGTAGVGATLTGNANGALAAQDGVTLVANDRLLVKSQAAGLQNGLYAVTQVGSGGTPFILTRVTDADTAAEVTSGLFCFVSEGTLNVSTGWILTTPDPITIGTTALTFTQFSGAGQVVAGAGLTKTVNQVDVIAGDASIVVNADELHVGVLQSDSSHGNRGGGAIHAAATGSVAGFMAAADKSKLDALPSSASRKLYTNTSVPGGNTVANSAAETAFASSYTIPANSLTAGQAIRVTAYGLYSTDIVAPALRGKLKLGSTVILDTGALTAVAGASNAGWKAEALIIVDAIGGSGSVEAQGSAQFATAATAALLVALTNTAAITKDTAVDEALTLTVQWGTASAANTITLRGLLVELVA